MTTGPRSGHDAKRRGTGTDAALVTYVLRLADDALIASQRLGEWVSRAPEIEEDVALANIALDLLGQARTLLSYAGEVEGHGRGEDDLAYLRHEREFRNCQLVEQPGDFALAVVRQLLFSTYQLEVYRRLAESSDDTLGGIAAKGVKEVAYHRDHAARWTVRLGDGTEESHRRVSAALGWLWSYVDDMFATDEVEAALARRGVAVDHAEVRRAWDASIDAVLSEAALTRPGSDAYTPPTGGRQGRHTETFGYLLAEMQHLARSHPGAAW